MKLNKSILKVGLTGGIGSGKSTVSTIFKQNNIPIIDADKIAKNILITHPEVLVSIRQTFGEEFFDENGVFLRRKLGNLIFSDNVKKVKYEEILMPYIFNDIFKKIEEYDDMGEDLCIIDAPTLIESNLHIYMDKIIVISVSEEIQIDRVMLRDEFTKEEAVMRINNQMSTKEKCKFADFIVDNNGDLHKTKSEVINILSMLRSIRGKNGL